MRITCALFLLCVVLSARVFSHILPSAFRSDGDQRAKLRDIDLVHMFRIRPSMLQTMQEIMARQPIHFLLIDNDQLSHVKAREIHRRLAYTPNLFAFGVGRKLSSYLSINYCTRYTHISCGATKDAADAGCSELPPLCYCTVTSAWLHGFAVCFNRYHCALCSHHTLCHAYVVRVQGHGQFARKYPVVFNCFS